MEAEHIELERLKRLQQFRKKNAEALMSPPAVYELKATDKEEQENQSILKYRVGDPLVRYQPNSYVCTTEPRLTAKRINNAKKGIRTDEPPVLPNSSLPDNAYTVSIVFPNNNGEGRPLEAISLRDWEGSEVPGMSLAHQPKGLACVGRPWKRKPKPK